MFKREGLARCPKKHTALGLPLYNQIDLKNNEGMGSKIWMECGLCFTKFKGEIIKVSERYENSK